jgi:DNA-binding Lrp family transcriptional regulator
MGMKKTDKKILLQLMLDAQQPVSEIAKKVGVTRQTVAKKITRLRESGIINSFTIRLNPERIGLGMKAYIFLREDPKTELRRRNEVSIKRLRQVSKFYRLFGRYSAILEAWVKDDKELTNLVKKIHHLKGVRETETFIVHSTVKDEPEEPFAKILKSSEPM